MRRHCSAGGRIDGGEIVAALGLGKERARPLEEELPHVAAGMQHRALYHLRHYLQVDRKLSII